jgi:hypothetical protein
MPETITKATPWAKQIRELTPTNKLPFPAEDSNYVHSLVSQIRKQFPLRSYKVETGETSITVTRLEDAAI